MAVTPDLHGEIEGIRKKFGLNDLYVVHGFAVQRDGKAYVMSGPPGIGKSTMLAGLMRQGARPIDDGFVLLGRKADGSHVVVSTGAFEPKRARTLIEQRLRRRYDYKSPFLDAEEPAEKRRRQRQEAFQTKVAQALTLFMPTFKEPFTPEEIPLERYALVHHVEDPMYVMHIDSDNRARKLPRDAFERHFSGVGAVVASRKGWNERVARFFGFGRR